MWMEDYNGNCLRMHLFQKKLVIQAVVIHLLKICDIFIIFFNKDTELPVYISSNTGAAIWWKCHDIINICLMNEWHVRPWNCRRGNRDARCRQVKSDPPHPMPKSSVLEDEGNSYSPRQQAKWTSQGRKSRATLVVEILGLRAGLSWGGNSLGAVKGRPWPLGPSGTEEKSQDKSPCM